MPCSFRPGPRLRPVPLSLSSYVLTTSALLTLSVPASVALHESGHALAALAFGGTLDAIHVTPSGGFVHYRLPPDAGPWTTRAVTAAGMLIELLVGPLFLLSATRITHASRAGHLPHSQLIATSASLFGAVCVLSVPLYCFWSLFDGPSPSGDLGDPAALLFSFLPPIHDVAALRASLARPFFLRHHGYWLLPAALLPLLGAAVLRPYLRAQSQWFPAARASEQRLVAALALGAPATLYALLVELIAPRPLTTVLLTIPLGLLTLLLVRTGP